MAVTFINAMCVAAHEAPFFLKMWEEGYDYVCKQPGFIASSLHRTMALNDQFQYYTIAVWENAEALGTATSSDWWIDFTHRFGFTGEDVRFTSVPALCEIVSDHNHLFTP